MSKEFKLRLKVSKDCWGIVDGHRVTNITKDAAIGDVRYSVYDLTECPEDATIYRDLFSGWEYIDALKLGMKIAKAGYDGISYEIEETEC